MSSHITPANSAAIPVGLFDSMAGRYLPREESSRLLRSP